MLEGIETLPNILKHNSYAELSELYKVGKEGALIDVDGEIFSPDELLYFAWAGCEGALVDIKNNLNSLDGDILIMSAISLAHLHQEKGFELLNAICANKAHIIMDEDDIYLLLEDHLHYVRHPKARDIEEKHLKNHPNNIFLE
ncbi:hypothetical protein NBRC116592_03680 [Colwellia sp. KU-HH00111]|uniref:hypothetical protein n=1 Tax=Colwellia sp. KU-HH00111 TaxID=3127652 RepID=UPI0031079EE3